MRLFINDIQPGQDKPTGYTLRLSANDTYNWARKPGGAWPCSETSGRRLRVEVDSNGLCDILVDGKAGEEIPGNELEAIVADHIHGNGVDHLWPIWA